MFRAVLGIPLLAVFLLLLQNEANAQQYENPPYSGYRIQLANIEILKEDDNYLKLSMDVANTGRQNVDLKRQDIRHWIQVLFTPEVDEGRLRLLKGNIREALFEKGLSLKSGQVKHDLNLRVSKLRKPVMPKNEVLVDTKPEKPANELPHPDESIAEKGGDAQLPEQDMGLSQNEPCPDIAFLHLYLKEEDDKYATLEYHIQNQGEGNFIIADETDRLIIRAFISGVPKLTRGALPIGGMTFEKDDGHPRMLRPGEKLIGEIKLDTRKKTRYMKCLILQLDSDQFIHECDRTNNSSAVILR